MPRSERLLGRRVSGGAVLNKEDRRSEKREARDVGLQPLSPLPDQTQRWVDFGQDPIPFEEGYRRVMEHHEEDGARQDIPINGLRSWWFVALGSLMGMRKIPLPGRGNDVVVPLRRLAWQQLCGKIDAPADYLSRMPSKVQLSCVNWDLSKQSKDALLRTARGEGRALLSSRYAAIDDAMYLDVVNDVLHAAGYRNDALVRVVASGPHTVLRVTIPNDAKAIKRNDPIEYGIDIGNSELGMRSVQITPVTYRLVCLNGMRSWRSEATRRMRHVGDVGRLRETLEDAVPVAIAEAKGDFDLWHKATERLIDDAFAEIESLQSFGFSKPEREAVGRQLAADNDLDGRNLAEMLKHTSTSVYDVANAITASAKGRGVKETDDDRDGVSVRVESRLRFEELGSDYLRRRAA